MLLRDESASAMYAALYAAYRDKYADANEGECGDASLVMKRYQLSAAIATRVLSKCEDRGIVVYHSAGSGKTCMVTAAMAAMWRTNRRLVYVTTREGLRANPARTFYACARSIPLAAGKSMLETEQMFRDRSVEFWSVARLAHYAKMCRPRKDGDANYLRGAVVFVDEAHSLFSPDPMSVDETVAFRKFIRNHADPASADTKFVLLTATPGSSPSEFARFFKLILAPHERDGIRTYADLQAAIKNRVSYYRAQDIDTQHFPETVVRTYRVPLTLDQMVEIAKRTAGGVGDHPLSADDLRADLRAELEGLAKRGSARSFARLPRAYMNTMFRRAPGQPLKAFSPKLAKLVGKVIRLPPFKHYVYSSFHERRGYGHGAHGIANALVDDAGYTLFPPAGDLPAGPALRVAVIDDAASARRALDYYNAPRNTRGQYLRVLVATRRFNEGIDLKDVKFVHIFEPLTSYVADEQTVARAVRYCSHSGLAKPWRVHVYRYTSVPSDVAATLKRIGERADLIASMIQRDTELLTAHAEADPVADPGADPEAAAKTAASKKALVERIEKLQEAGRKLRARFEAIRGVAVPPFDDIIDDIVTDQRRALARMIAMVSEASFEANLSNGTGAVPAATGDGRDSDSAEVKVVGGRQDASSHNRILVDRTCGPGLL